ncbi:SprT-like family protein [Salana multivorans]|uniref:SprT-like family protein n=1 Tax=Salana multivorans TaxID=120377 RepID=A0A3N2DAV9_9MICO|nr:SprT-like domain-containing protein [Salana multivorans]MBN8881466.1 SprT-like domain-containing protein [Salana multivorans]OJX96947.1 MAG: hypothetical protein BGO96_02450 [Micrococcales bacterium 73-15]ROR96788.1 SprT-like family protein [Salana multivorans]
MELFEVRRMAVELLARHGLGGWRVTFDRAKTRAGRCSFSTHEISLSAPLMRLQEYPEVRDTILHEIAHALVGPAHGHDEAWRTTAQRIGASGDRVLRTDALPVQDWVGTCRAGHRVARHRRPIRPMLCETCARAGQGAVSGGGGATSAMDAMLVWRYKGRPVPMTPAYRAAEAAMRARATSNAPGQRGA